MWFLENVWHHIKNYGYKLYIVGKNPSDSIKKFEDSNVVITGYVDDINEYIELCDFSIITSFIWWRNEGENIRMYGEKYANNIYHHRC